MSQKALLLHAVGTPVVLEERPIPEPGENELLVKVTAASLNPHDQKVRDFGLLLQSGLAVLANDLAGEVVKLGPGAIAATYSVGEHVFAQSSPNGNGPISADTGGLQEYTIVNAKHAAKVADSGLTDDEAVTLPTNTIPPFLALFHESGHGFPPPWSSGAATFDYASKTLLVLGAGTNCGRYTIQVAKMAGIGQIIAVAGKRNEGKLKDLGATCFIDRHTRDILKEIRDVTGDNLVYAVDAFSSRDSQQLGLAALSNSKKGVLLVLTQPQDDKISVDSIGSKTAGYECRMIKGSSQLHSEFAIEFFKHIAGWARDGKIKPSNFEVIEGLDAGKVNEALDYYRDGKETVKRNVHP
ncbi:hypothetical protein FQN53_000268 [Emmonsiellopsis sp. PD_33]|nr:hypothetical protein FQN53_000268 [Emmonsiellopsis sp. PD_33]